MTGRNLVGLNPAGVDAIMAQEAVSSPGQAGAVTWMVDDNLGSDRNVVNNNGAIVDTTGVAMMQNMANATLDGTSNFFAGYANIVTFGQYNKLIGGNAAFVDTNSWSYTIGQGVGWAWWGTVGASLAWTAMGAPTYGVGIGPSSQQPFHLFFGTAKGSGPMTWYHAVGRTEDMWIIEAGSQATGGMWAKLTGIPIASTTAIGTAPGAYNCISAAAWGLVQGWAPFV